MSARGLNERLHGFHARSFTGPVPGLQALWKPKQLAVFLWIYLLCFVCSSTGISHGGVYIST